MSLNSVSATGREILLTQGSSDPSYLKQTSSLQRKYLKGWVIRVVLKCEDERGSLYSTFNVVLQDALLVKLYPFPFSSPSLC